jgi:hypothetical protein
MSARDKRVSLMNEVLQSVRMIKYLAFEKVSTDVLSLGVEADGVDRSRSRRGSWSLVSSPRQRD